MWMMKEAIKPYGGARECLAEAAGWLREYWGREGSEGIVSNKEPVRASCSSEILTALLLGSLDVLVLSVKN